MSARNIIRQARLNEWAAKFSDQKASGLKVADWCKQNNVSKDTYFYWKRQVKNAVISQALPDIVPLAITPAVVPNSSTELVSSDAATCTTCTTGVCAKIHFGEFTVELDVSAPESFIRSVIKAVRYA
ncbi:MAG: hypothetical protein J6X36_03090 [Lachnospiraceae bacterium]|nr:hypothetical protein [Lachnospiraceae bacterium]